VPAARRSAPIAGWSEPIYRTWYLTGAVWTAAWLGLGTTFLLGRTRFGYSFALCLFLAGLFTFLAGTGLSTRRPARSRLLYFIVAGILALAVAIETYFANDRWPLLAAAAVVGRDDPQRDRDGDDDAARPRATRWIPRRVRRSRTLIPPELRLFTPFMNITGRSR
jgi:hypothetical protein